MACGLPGIAANALGPSRILTEGETGWLFEPHDREDLTRALVEAVNHPEERQRRGRVAREEALRRLSWPPLARGLDAVLREVAGLPLGPREGAERAETVVDG